MSAETIIPIITALIASGTTLGVIWLKYFLKQRAITAKEGPIEKCVGEDVEIIENLKEISKELGADRVSIFSFHNGGQYYSGKSMQKMSISYEVVSEGIASIQLEKQNIPVSACVTTLKPLVDYGEFHCCDIKDYPEGLCKYHLLKDGVRSTYQYAIMDLEDKAIGMVRMDYIKKGKWLNDEEFETLRIFSLKLPGYLMSKTK